MSEYCYVEDQGDYACRYVVRLGSDDHVLARFNTRSFATWFCATVNAAYRLAADMDHD